MHLRPAPHGENRRLEAAEFGHPPEAGEVAVMRQPVMARLANEPAVFPAVEAAMEEVVELGSCRWLPLPGEDVENEATTPWLGTKSAAPGLGVEASA